LFGESSLYSILWLRWTQRGRGNSLRRRFGERKKCAQGR